jgi:hypothetical protein
VSKVRHVDFDARGVLIRVEPSRVLILPSGGGTDGALLATFPCTADDLRHVARGGTYQINGPDGYLLARATSEGAWFLFENPAQALSGSCLIPLAKLSEALGRLG